MSDKTEQNKFMEAAVGLSLQNMRAGKGGPFGAVVVKDGQIVAEGFNQVTSSNDPTAHAEVVAIRNACEALGSFQLEGCDLYTSCEPCPMCLGAIYWARPDRVFYANTKTDAAAIGFDDQFIYEEIVLEPLSRKIPFIHIETESALASFREWANKQDKIEY